MINLPVGLLRVNAAAFQQPLSLETIASPNKMLISAGIKHIYIACSRG